MFFREALILLGLLVTNGLWAEDGPAKKEGTVKKGDVVLEWCQPEGAEEKILCGVYEVYEDREAMSGRTIKLNIVIAPALGENPEPDPIFFFNGGPGVGAAAVAGWAANDLKSFRQDRDLVFIDQRGTGKSNGLNCEFQGPKDSVQTYLGDMFE